MQLKSKIEMNIRKIKNTIRSNYFMLKHFSIFRKNSSNNKYYILCVDGIHQHGGLCDRFKGIISLYAYCISTHKEFKIYYNTPFNISDYLIPNSYNWLLQDNEFSNCYLNAKIVDLVSDPKGNILFSLKSKKQIHIYLNYDLIPYINSKFNLNHDWGKLYKELFKPTEQLGKLIKHHQSQIGENYISVHFRFLNLLGDFNEKGYFELSSTNKNKLINKCLDLLNQVNKSQPIFISTDSITFLNIASKIDNIYAINQSIMHIDYDKKATKDSFMKTFLDFYLISEGRKVYSIVIDDMYKSDFPVYAAKINNIPFERIIK